MTGICLTLASVLSRFMNSYFSCTLKWKLTVPSNVCTKTQTFSISVHSEIEHMKGNASHTPLNV